jgi:hypothetical protein
MTAEMDFVLPIGLGAGMVRLAQRPPADGGTV